MAALQQMEMMLKALMAQDNDVRGQAEASFNQAKSRADDLLTALAATMRQSQEQECRAMAAILFRRITPELFAAISQPVRDSLKLELMNAVKDETIANVRHKVCDATSLYASYLFEQPVAPQDFLRFLFEMSGSPNDDHKESALTIFAQLAEQAGDALAPHAPICKNVFASCLAQGQSLKVRLASFEAAAAFLQLLDDDSMKGFQDLIPSMLETLNEALTQQKEDEANTCLQLLIGVADETPKFFRRSLQQLLQISVHIASTDSLEDGIRQLAMELLLTFTEKAPKMCRSVSDFTPSVVQVALKMMLELEDTPEWHQGTDEDDEECTNYDIGQEALDRLAIAMKGPHVLAVCSQHIGPFLQNPDWRYRHAALITISQIGEGCLQEMQPLLGTLIGTILSHFNDPHPRVRWAAINCIGQMCTDFGPTLQEGYHQTVLPALASVMDDPSFPRVQSHAAAALINFCEYCSADLISVYLGSLLAKLHGLLQSGKRLVQEQAITAIAAIADSAKEMFTPYYDTFMPLLKAVLGNTTMSKEHATLRGKAMECISLVACAVDKAKFMPDAKEIISYMQHIQNQNLPSDDPQISYMMQAWGRLCKALGRDFEPYLPIVIPSLLKSASLKPDIQVTDDNEDELEGMDTIQVGDKRIGIQTSVLEEKATACSMLSCYIAELEDVFLPYLQDAAQIVVPNLTFYYSDDVREAAVQCIPDLLRVAKSSFEAGKINDAAVPQLFAFIYPRLIQAIENEPEYKFLTDLLEALCECIEIVGENCVNDAQMNQICDLLVESMKESDGRREERNKAKDDECYDADELEEENEIEDLLFEQIGCVVGALIKQCKARFAPMFHAKIMPIFANKIQRQQPALQRRVSVCVFDDLIEYLGPLSAPFLPTCMPFLLEYIVDVDPDLRQASVYGVGVLAQHGGEAFAMVAQDALMKINALVSHPEARKDANGAATDNAISALGKICEYQDGRVDSASLWPTFLNYLPLRHDVAEARMVHNQLVALVEKNNVKLLGSQNENLPIVLSVFSQILDTELVDDETVPRIKNLLHQLRSLPEATLQALFSRVPEKNRDVLLRNMQS
eukprot:TRINITY_DN2321_c0_g1::TRINITY_DN2321_c0_g1_i1::g.20738::m.20738 TRINITY_DN2321_c0_g1::TRINITY_DN2321_c0_g1_i1::g.20738  ORF type:complete len:1078 (+),score=394.95,sp/Q8BKC5/IPO5_MOUSE/35.22/0.0,HEAT/PF02985.17/3.9e+03,HEAT/PF02985.17/7.7,HEAT/PF02985.17/2.6e+03,HEAT/PF02985.17/4.8e+03,HEAT/PF02985.17/0.24,HEAT/PF02985.17/6e-06,HEAT/PF02985.17/0.067,HEAT/PF02985.17/3.5e+02,HEAT/PF02985.17/1.7,HEAT/PF02985.17/0.053,HEAT/PF02985.17/6e+02,HEAT_2/PF13646.1/1.2e+02,HEAT_2/PF13646.1/14,HEAT_2/PF13646.